MHESGLVGLAFGKGSGAFRSSLLTFWERIPMHTRATLGMAHFYTATGPHETLRVTALVRKVGENVGLTSLVNLNLRYYGCCAARYPLVNVVSYVACLSMLSFVSIFTGNILAHE